MSGKIVATTLVSMTYEEFENEAEFMSVRGFIDASRLRSPTKNDLVSLMATALGPYLRLEPSVRMVLDYALSHELNDPILPAFNIEVDKDIRRRVYLLYVVVGVSMSDQDAAIGFRARIQPDAASPSRTTPVVPATGRRRFIMRRN